jgi:hypothetical protein
MSSSFAARIAARFAPLDFTNVYGFPNTVPDIKIWADILPKFGEYEDDNPGQHLFEFHKLMEELNVHHEDVLMKLFMFSLENDARLWYKSLPHSSIPSLRCFHILFHQHCKRIYSAEILFEDCCDTSPLEEEEETIEISRVDEDEQYEEELAHKDAGSCELTQEEDQILDSALFHEKDMAAMFNDPEHHESEHRVVMDVLKPQYDMFFQDPFADLLDSFNGGICSVMNVWSQELMKGLHIHDHQQVRWGLSTSFFSLLEESVKKFQVSRQLLDWLHWHFRII